MRQDGKRGNAYRDSCGRFGKKKAPRAPKEKLFGKKKLTKAQKKLLRDMTVFMPNGGLVFYITAGELVNEVKQALR
jgi:5-formaminoimidazole-4-carboxamide-1-beta-D-ribofuranosyl 5'-monophosphate synthetase